MDPNVWDVFVRDNPPPNHEEAPRRMLSVRMPPEVYEYLSVMAEHADQSRNSMAVQLIEWGISYALAEMPEDIREEIRASVLGEDYTGPEA